MVCEGAAVPRPVLAVDLEDPLPCQSSPEPHVLVLALENGAEIRKEVKVGRKGICLIYSLVRAESHRVLAFFPA